eukprot:TRINITY_DN4514_c0_g1_i1.p1 TRINITY_DN4514_c0_g1~~TRINITY_DN4514_c0_g1_i1.p1  ORF type:complete len:1483 (-),score=198.68 TRINITY_DN4514_c0_g1_i1:336-4784(-)
MDEDDFNPDWAISIAPPSRPSIPRGGPPNPAAPVMRLIPLNNQETRGVLSSSAAVAPTSRATLSPTSPKISSVHASAPLRQNSPNQGTANVNNYNIPQQLPLSSPSRALNVPGPGSFVVAKRTQSGPGSVRPKGPPSLPTPGVPPRSGPIGRESVQSISFLDEESIISEHKTKPPPFSARSANNFSASRPTAVAASRATGLTAGSAFQMPAPQSKSTLNPPLAEGGFPPVNTSATVSPPVVDLDAIHTWHCPIGDVSLREYQRSIVYSGLLNNTLVCLPTGLGKTRIAAVIMYNFYRWFPSGKIIFMAPTKPLVNQQIEACHAVGGFAQNDMISMTGTMHAPKRAEEWKRRRIVFCTPQTAENDIDSGICPPDSIVLLVIDEAHKATGNYAYVNVVRKVASAHPRFRVIALSATPGSSNDAIQTVVSNLLISKIEVRTDESDDVRSHMHEREIEKIEVPLGEAVQAVRDAFSRVLSVPIKYLQESGALFRRSLAGLTKGAIFTARNNWRQSFHNQSVRDEGKKIMIESNYALALTLYHGNGLLLDHGILSFKNWRDGVVAKQSSASRLTQEMLRSAEWAALDAALAKASSASSISHPKMAKLEELIVAHFRSAAEHARVSNADISKCDTRAIIFTQYRDSVTEIVDSLKAFSPLVKAVAFVGQSKGLTQKQQLQIMKDFKNGVCNTLVATSIGEEGLDVGEVDLIVCFDAQASPQRMVQRMGRTGRQRKGRIVLLLSPGEKFTQKRAETKNQSMNKAVADGAKFRCYHPQVSIFPDDVVPECLEVEFPRFESFVAPLGRREKAKSTDTTLPIPKDESVWHDAIHMTYSAQSNFLSDCELQYLHENYAFSLDDLSADRIELGRFQDHILPSPVGAVSHSSVCLAYLQLMNDIRDSDFAAEPLHRHPAASVAQSYDLVERAPKRRKISERLKPLADDSKYVSLEHKVVEEERELLDPVPGVSRTEAPYPDSAFMNGGNGAGETSDDDIQLFTEPTPSRDNSGVLPNQNDARENHFQSSEGPVDAPKPSLFKRAPQQSQRSSQQGHVHTQVPKAPLLPFGAAFEEQEWLIPEIAIEEDPPVNPPCVVPLSPAPRQTSPLKHSSSNNPLGLCIDDTQSPIRAIELSSLTSPPRQHRRLRRGLNFIAESHAVIEPSFNEEDALIASLNQSSQDSLSVSPSPEKVRPARTSKPIRDDVSALFDLEPELSGDDEDHEEEDEENGDFDSSWLTDSPDSSMNADVNMQAIYRQSLLSQMSPSSKPPGADGFSGTPKRHNRNHFKMRFLDSSAKERHDAALRGALDPPLVSKQSGAIRHLFRGTPPSQPKSSSDFEDDIVSSFQENVPQSRVNSNNGIQFAEKSVSAQFSAPTKPLLPRAATVEPQFRLRPPLPSPYSRPVSASPRAAGVGALNQWNPPRANPNAPSVTPSVGPHHDGNKVARNPSLFRVSRIDSAGPVEAHTTKSPVYDDPDFDSALAELDIDAILRTRSK